MPLAAFDKLYAEFEPIHHQRLRSAGLIRRTKTPHRIVVEHTIAQMNKFQVLRQVFRHKRESHTQLVRIVAGLVNRQIQGTPLKTYAVV
jgi:hypothetical protein